MPYNNQITQWDFFLFCGKTTTYKQKIPICNELVNNFIKKKILN